ncbi:hypothetical protein ABTX35_03150 [Streptomyces sp. NPDC096080]|jgi:hypothetical protein|uniref:hypothetical protein n=1 Tax=Streptomyces sp. NPDC096080 TaxID=3156693 RepID=UPI00332EE1ED
MFVNLRMKLPCMSVAFVAALVLGIVLILSPAAQSGGLEETWRLLAIACLLLCGQSARRNRDEG